MKEISLDTVVLDETIWIFLFEIKRLGSSVLLSVALDKQQLVKGHSPVKQQAGMEDFVCRGFVPQPVDVISMEATAKVGDATSIKTAAINAIKIDFAYPILQV